MSKQQWNGKSKGTRLGYQIFIWFIKVFGVRFAYFNLSYVVFYYVLFSRKSRKSSWFLHRKILHYGLLKSIWGVYLHHFRFAQCLVDRIAIQNGKSDSFKMYYDNYESLLQVLDEHRGAVLIGAHYGGWQVGSSFFGKYGSQLNLVMLDAEYQSIKEIVDKDRNYIVIPITDDNITTMLSIKRVLNNGEFVGFQGDRFTDNERFVRKVFMGREADFPEGPFVLASKLKVPVIFYFAIREGMSYRYCFDVLGCGLSKDEIIDRYVLALEDIMRKDACQWFNFYPFWV